MAKATSVPGKKKKSLFKRTVAWLHLWPSLVASVILIFVCLTGTIIVYCDEIIDWVNRDVLYVPEVKEDRLPAEELLRIFHEKYPARRNPSYIVTYKDPARSVKLNSYDPKIGLQLIYMDPYTGEILKEDTTIFFFFITAHLHNSLMLGKAGAWIIDISTIIFLIGLITGIVLWWPKKWNKTGVNRSFTIRWRAKFKRVNYDLHNVVGFYTLFIVLVLTVTGLIIAFEPLSALTINAFGGDGSHAWESKELPRVEEERPMASLQSAIDRHLAQDEEANAAVIYSFRLKQASNYILITASQMGLKSYVGHAHFINKYTGHDIQASEGELHQAIENGYWMLHMGTWLGWLGKLVTFIGGLVATSLPITGFIIWWGKRKKKSHKKDKKGKSQPKPQDATVAPRVKKAGVQPRPVFNATSQSAR